MQTIYNFKIKSPMRPLSESAARVAGKNFSRKYMALGRIVNQWTDIMGDEFADKAQPVKINYRKAPHGTKSGTKNKKATATLDIATTASYATILPYQKNLILERINQLFGDQWITDIRFVIGNIAETRPAQKKTTSPLTPDEKKYLSNVLNSVDDPVFREKLSHFGQALLGDKKS